MVRAGFIKKLLKKSQIQHRFHKQWPYLFKK